MVAELELPGTRSLTFDLLTPELAVPVSRADYVVFVDAAIDAPKEVQMRPLEPSASSQIMAHAANPGTLLALSRDLFSHTPKAWWLTIPATEMGFSETLSAKAAHGMDVALEKIRQLAESLVR
jgi:Ni,Fe-hydrogenase maturation factor